MPYNTYRKPKEALKNSIAGIIKKKVDQPA